MRAPRDWVMTVTDMDDMRYLVEIREDGRLALRRTLSADAVVIDNELAFLISEARNRARAGGGGR